MEPSTQSTVVPEDKRSEKVWKAPNLASSLLVDSIFRISPFFSNSLNFLGFSLIFDLIDFPTTGADI